MRCILMTARNIIHCDQAELIIRIQTWFWKSKTTNMIHYINKMKLTFIKQSVQITTLMEIEKTFKELTHICGKNIFTKLRIENNFLNKICSISLKHTNTNSSNFILNGEISNFSWYVWKQGQSSHSNHMYLISYWKSQALQYGRKII